ncbi:unnamed protein product, partial [Didymodactylos carnosus]
QHAVYIHSVVTGENYKMDCSSETGNGRVTWIKNNKPLILTNRNKYEVESRNVVIIKNVTKEDVGIYFCESKNKDFSRKYLLTLKNEQDIPLTFETVGDETGLYCYPDHKITTGSNDVWLKDGKILPNDSQQNKYIYDEHVLSIKNITKNDAGVYSCQHSGSVHPMTRLIVEKNRSHTNRMYAFADEDIGLECYPGNKIKLDHNDVIWLKDDKPLSLVNNQDKYVQDKTLLLIYNLSNEDTGVYSCKYSGGIHVVENLILLPVVMMQCFDQETSQHIGKKFLRDVLHKMAA